MRILICDDEMDFIEELKSAIHSFFDEKKLAQPQIAIFQNGSDLLCDTGTKDIVFLDVQMPEPNGIYIGHQIKKSNPTALIFIVTSHINYLDDAMRFHVFRYLAKPLDVNRLFRNLQDALFALSSLNFHIALETRDGIYNLSVSDIIYLDISSRKVNVHTMSEVYISIHPMTYWMNLLPGELFQLSHKGVLINYGHVKNFDHSHVYFDMISESVYMSRRNYTSFKEGYLLYLESRR